MNLFNKEKDLIHRIANLVLLLWLIISITVFYVNVVNNFFTESFLDFEDYETVNCYYMYKEDLDEEFCKRQYQDYLRYSKTDISTRKKIIFNSLGSVLIVSGALYMLNKKKKEVK